MFKILSELSGSKLNIITLNFDIGHEDDFTALSNLFQSYINLDKLNLSVSSDIVDPELDDDVELDSLNFDCIKNIPSPSKKLVLTVSYGDLRSVEENRSLFCFISSLDGDARFKIVLGKEETRYAINFCRELILHYLEYDEPKNLIKVIKFGRQRFCFFPR
jgi:hypothetical protein